MKAWTLCCEKCKEPAVAFSRQIGEGEIMKQEDIIQHLAQGPWENGDMLICKKCRTPLNFQTLTHFKEVEFTNPNTH